MKRKWLLGLGILGCAAIATSDASKSFAQTGVSPNQEVWQFNQKFQEAHLRMDTDAIIGMWSENGVSLLPETAPITGKGAVGSYIRDAVASLAGYKMLK